jgi:hypothetical protein
MRTYFFGNMYLSSIQQGIQGEHVAVSLFVKYRHKPEALDVVYDWAENHKTSIYLNGGYASNLYKIHEEIEAIDALLKNYTYSEMGRAYLKLWGLNETNPYLPHNLFHEEEDSLNGSLTSVCVVLPEYFYNRDLHNMELIERKIASGDELRADERMIKLLSGLRLAS